MLKKLENYIIPLFLVAWTILNLFQAGYSELLHDEAYYWMYSRWLSFGYFDHPPMIALFIKLGYGLFNSELGVRFVTVITTSITLGIVWYLCKWYFAKPWLYILICLSISFLHFLGFLAIPDSPLFFFTAVFLVAYRSYLWKTSLFNTLLLAAAMAAMMYSKYHGALIIIFTIASNPKLLTRWSFWLAGLIALILFAPHMIWQVENEYPSIMYHLIDRSNRPYSILNTLSFIGGQLLIFGPICGIILMYSAIKQKTESEFGRTLKFILIGTFIFFFLASFKGWVEGNWTAPLLIPMIILGYKSLGTNENLRKWFLRFAIPMIILIIPARVYFVYDFLPEKYSLRTDIHNWKTWAEELKKVAGDHPVVLQNSYQKASKYAFYSGGSMVHSSNNHWYRKNQFDIWNFEEQFQGDSVLFIANTEVGSW
ncbi:MAG: 4-amino-4-deoxy-L-arabinose transferase-like glycosyltransferase, partial [Sphingobacteriales bacterium]